jgi:hypothetical protein
MGVLLLPMTKVLLVEKVKEEARGVDSLVHRCGSMTET